MSVTAALSKQRLKSNIGSMMLLSCSYLNHSSLLLFCYCCPAPNLLLYYSYPVSILPLPDYSPIPPLLLFYSSPTPLVYLSYSSPVSFLLFPCSHPTPPLLLSYFSPVTAIIHSKVQGNQCKYRNCLTIFELSFPLLCKTPNFIQKHILSTLPIKLLSK